MFTLVVFLLTRLRRRRWRGVLLSQVVEVEKTEEVEGEEGEAGRLSITLRNYILIFFFLLFHFSKNVPIQY